MAGVALWPLGGGGWGRGVRRVCEGFGVRGGAGFGVVGGRGREWEPGEVGDIWGEGEGVGVGALCWVFLV